MPIRQLVSCGSGLGHLRDPSNTNADMRELFAFCGQPGLTNHIWRRTVATIMEPSGLSARAGADEFGHRQGGTTMNHYRGQRHTLHGSRSGSGSLAFWPRVPDRP
jgi:integrase